MQPIRAPSTVTIHTDSQSAIRVLHQNEVVEFFTGMEPSPNPFRSTLMAAIQDSSQMVFGNHMINMKKAIFAHLTKVHPKLSADTNHLAAVRFSFTKHEDVIFNCPIPANDLEAIDDQTLSNRIFTKCLIGKNILALSNNNETIIVNQRYLTSITILRGAEAMFALQKKSPL